MNNSDNPYAPESGMTTTGSVSFGGGNGPAAGPAPAAAAGEAVFDTTTADFKRDVIDASRQAPVLVDFWAPWCGPCKQLTPILEKAVREAGGRVRLAKMNIDDHPAIPGQLGIQSIPAVVAFVDGQPVDGFMGAVPESQVKELVGRLSGRAGPDPQEEQIVALLAEAKSALDAGSLEMAAQMFSAVLNADPNHPGAIGGLAACLVDTDALDEAEQLLGQVPEEKRKDPAVALAVKRLELAREVSALGDPAEMEARIAANDNDFDARLTLAKILNARGDRDGAAAQLFAIMRKDRGWNDEAARKQLLEFFEAWGMTDPATLAARRQLSSLLFS